LNEIVSSRRGEIEGSGVRQWAWRDNEVDLREAKEELGDPVLVHLIELYNHHNVLIDLNDLLDHLESCPREKE